MREDERGFALLLVAVLATLGMAFWSLAYRATGDSIRSERILVQRDDRDRTVTRELAIGVALLRTGTPRSKHYACIVEVADVACVVTYGRKRDKRTWSVEARLASKAQRRRLPRAPISFRR